MTIGILTLFKYCDKYRHQRCKAPNICKTFFITNNCRLKEAGQKKYIFHNDVLTTSFSQRPSHNVFFTTSCWWLLSHNVFFITSFSQCLSHKIFLTMSFSQSLSQNVFLTTSFSQCFSHNVFLTPFPLHICLATQSLQRHNIRVIFRAVQISQNISFV